MTSDVQTASGEALKSMSGLALFQAMLAGEVPPPSIAETLDFRLVDADHGRAVFEGAPSIAVYNPLGTVHGGWAMTLLDSCVGCAVHTTLQPGERYTTLELKTNFVRPITAKTGAMRAEGAIIHRGRRTATAEGRLVDADGKLYAHATTTCMVFPAEEA